MKKLCGFIAVATCVAAVSIVDAAAAPALRFQSVAELDSVGIVVPLMGKAREVPPKPVDMLRWRFSDGQMSWTEDRGRVRDLWAETQFAASWTDESGNAMLIAEMTKMPPVQLGEHATRDAFDKALEDPALDVDINSTYPRLADWVAAFCGMSVKGMPETVLINRSRLDKVVQFTMSDSRTQVFAFRINPSYPGQAEVPRNWFAIILTFAAVPDDETNRAIEKDFLGGIKTTSKFDGTRAVSIRKNRTRDKSKPLLEDATRARARRSIRLMPSWWYMDSPNYIMLSNHRAAEQFASEILAELEGMLPYFETAVPKFKTADDSIGVVRLFSDDFGYISYFGNDFTHADPSITGGMFMPTRNELVIRPVSTSLKSSSEGSIRGIIKHEGLHQYISRAFGGVSPSPWFNEGFAVFFQSTDLDRYGKLTVLESYHADKLAGLISRGDIDWAEYLAAFLKMDYDRFYTPDGENYTIAYGIIYYLMRGAPEERNKPYANIMQDYRDELAKSGKADVATDAAFGKIDMKKFSDDFKSFWTTSKKRQDAKRKKGL